MKTFLYSFLKASLFVCICFLNIVPGGQELWAANYNWVGSAGGDWANAANWQPTAVPSNNSVLTIGAGASPTIFSAGQAAGTINVSGTASNPTYINTVNGSYALNLGYSSFVQGIAGGTLYFGSNFNVNLMSNQSWNADQIYFASSTSHATLSLNSYTLTLGSNSSFNTTYVDLQQGKTLVTGTGSITLTKGATLAIGGAVNTFSGGILVKNGGVLDLNEGTATQGLGTGTLALQSGSTMTFGSSTNIKNNYSFYGAISMAGSTSNSTSPNFSGTGTLLQSTILNLTPGSLFGLVFNGTLGGSASLTLNNTDPTSKWINVSFFGQNTFNGGLVANAGIDVLINADSTSSGGTITSGPVGTGTLTLGGGDLSLYSYASHTLDNNINLSTGTSSSIGRWSYSGATMTLGGVISGSGSLTKLGGSTLTFTGSSANTFTGGFTISGGQVNFNKTAGVNAIGSGSTITINSNSVLNLQAANQIPTGVNMVLNGGTFMTGGLSVVSGNASLGTLTLAANSYINLGSGSTILKYANSSGTTWTDGTILYVTGWNGTLDTGGGSTQLIFGSDATGLSSTQLSQILFANPSGLPEGYYSATMLSTGEIVPGAVVVPEASTVCMGVVLSAFALCYLVKRKRPLLG